jgi:uncharacterized protein (TIGR04222 family)
LTYPPDATLLEQPTLNRDFDTAREAGRIVLISNGLAEDEDLILTARFHPSSLTQVAPQWQVDQQRADAAIAKALPVGLVGGIATLILGGLGLFVYARAHRRELNLSPVITTPNPPADISPAVIGKLTGQHHNFMGAIFDLAQRGVLEVREEKGSWGAKKHILLRQNHSEPLRPFEQGLMDALFKSGESQINMNEVAARLGSKSKLFDEPLEQELVRRGWLDLDRKRKRTVLSALGILTLILAVIGFILSMVGGGVILRENSEWLPYVAGLAGISAGMFILSIPFLIYAGTYSILTPVGEEQSARWKGFAEYLKQASKGKEPAIRPDYFELYLAYAAVFGLGAGWAKFFKDLGGVPLPVWFHTMAGSDGGFAGMVAIMSASDSAGASAGAGGAAGASGGGSSGAG